MSSQFVLLVFALGLNACKLNPGTTGQLDTPSGALTSGPRSSNADPNQGFSDGTRSPIPVPSPSISSVAIGTDSTSSINAGIVLNVTGSSLSSVSAVRLYSQDSNLLTAALNPMASCSIQGGRTDGSLKCAPTSNLTSSLSSGFKILFSTLDPSNFVEYSVNRIVPPAISSTLSLNIGPSPSPSATPDFSVNRGGSSHFVQVGGSHDVVGLGLRPKLYVVGSGAINSASASLNVTNSSNASLFQIKDDGAVTLGDPNNPNTIDFYEPVSIPSPSLFHVQGNVSLTGTFTYTPSPSPSPLKGIGRLSIAQSNSDATVALTAGPEEAIGYFALRVESAPTGAGTSPEPLFLIGNTGISRIGASPSPSPWPSADARTGLIVNKNVQLSGPHASLILSQATGNLVPNNTNCNNERKGYLTIDLLKLPCICNGTKWVNALEGSRGCFLRRIQTDADCPERTVGSFQPAPNPAPSTWPSINFCKYLVDGGAGRNNRNSNTGNYNSNNWNCPDGWSKYANYRQTKETCCDAANQCEDGLVDSNGAAGQGCKVQATNDFINRDQLPSCGYNSSGSQPRTCYADVNYGGCY